MIALRARRKLTLVRQMEEADCGAACLATALRYLGRRVPLDDLSEPVVLDDDERVDGLAQRWDALLGLGGTQPSAAS